MRAMRYILAATCLWLAATGALAAGPWMVEDFILYESRLGHTGAAYEEVARYALRG
jgi:2'-5' RNA ligase